MAFDLGAIVARITGDNSSFKKALKEASGFGQQFRADLNNAISDISKTFGVLTDAVKFVGSALIDAIGPMSEYVDLAAEQETLNLKLAQTFKDLGEGAFDAMQDFKDFAAAFQDLTGIDNEIIEETGILLANMNVPVDLLDDGVEAAHNLSQALGVDLSTAAQQIGLTMSGMAGRLSKIIPELADLTEEELKNGGAIDVINAKYVNFAETLQFSASVQLKRVGADFDDLKKGIGQVVIDSDSFRAVLELVSDALQEASKWLIDNEEKFIGWGDTLIINLSFVAQAVVDSLGTMVTWFQNFFIVVTLGWEAILKGAKAFAIAQASVFEAMGKTESADKWFKRAVKLDNAIKALGGNLEKQFANLLKTENATIDATAAIQKMEGAILAKSAEIQKAQLANEKNLKTEQRVRTSAIATATADEKAADQAAKTAEIRKKALESYLKALEVFNNKQRELNEEVQRAQFEQSFVDEELHQDRMRRLRELTGGVLFGAESIALLSEEQILTAQSVQTAWDSLFENMSLGFANAVADMTNFANRSKSMQAVISLSFKLATSAFNAMGSAWQQTVLTGTISMKTFGIAMQQMVAQELAAISASALVNALYATAIGFIRLAQFNFPAAASAFTAAGMFAAVAAITGVAAAALSTGGGEAGAAGGDDFDDRGKIGDAEDGNQQRFLQIDIHGNIIGQEEWLQGVLIPEINKAVVDQDIVLISTDSKSPGSISGSNL